MKSESNRPAGANLGVGKADKLAAPLLVGVIYFVLFNIHNVIAILPVPNYLRAWKELVQLISIPYFIGWAITRMSGSHLAFAVGYILMMLLALPAFHWDVLVLSLSGFLMLFGNAGVAALFVDALKNRRTLLLVHVSAAIIAIATMAWLPFEERLGLGTFFLKTDENGEIILMMRDNYLRARFVFDSPLDASQAAWFIGVLLCWLGVFHTKSVPLMWTSIALGVGVVASSLFTYTRAGIFLSLTSLCTLLVIGTLTGRRLGKLYLTLTAIGVLGATFLLASRTAYEALAGLIASSLDRSESGNALRGEKIETGLRELDQIPTYGYGLDVLTPRSGLDTFINFENTYLNVIGAIGVGGYVVSFICILILFVGSAVSLRRVIQDPENATAWLAAMLGPSWALYSMLFPCFRGRMSGYLIWIVMLVLLEISRHGRMPMTKSALVGSSNSFHPSTV